MKFTSILFAVLLMLPWLLSSCQGPSDRANSWSGAERVRGAAETLSIELLDKAEDERSLERVFLERMLRKPSPAVRQKAAEVAGRSRFKEGAAALIEAGRREQDPQVMASIAFSLGQLGDSRALDSLVQWSAPPWPIAVRKAAITALGRIVFSDDDRASKAPVAVSRLIEILEIETEETLSHEAALALWRYGADSVAGISVLARRLEEEHSADPWPYAYALMKIDHLETSAPLRRALAHRSGLVRTYAAWGCRQPLDPRSVDGLDALLLDPVSPWTARVEALRTFGKLRELEWERADQVRDVLLRHLIQEQHPLVAPVVVESLGIGATSVELPFIIGSLDRERSEAVRSAAVGALAAAAKAGLVTPIRCAEILAEFSREDSPWIRSASAVAIASLGVVGIPSLEGFLIDPDRRVRAAAVSALQSIEDPAVEALILRALRDADVSVKMPAAQLAASRKIKNWQQQLKRLWARSLDAESWELRVQLLGHLGETNVGELLARQALDDPFRTVRSAAATLLQIPTPPLAGRCPAERITPRQLTGEGPPRVFLQLESGTMVIELDLAAAPRHVSAFIDGVRRKFYDGRIFHRVVASFVAQGGGPRGDGWGDEGWHLIDEIHPRTYRRGTIGMPKAGDDTGGSQIFITHLPTPHLDGRYTVFGQVVEGLQFLDQIEVGSRIVKITVDESRFRKRVAF
ncbi:MAG: peptidylprolyl isomerase [Planctomycetota bacterium]|nr:peptidylprolyl isomerase [Planctomycetota bacterium]